MIKILSNTESFEDVVIACPELKEIGKKIKPHLSKILPEHLGHTVRLSYDGSIVLWVHCLDCNMLWTHCDFCMHCSFPGWKGSKRLIDFDCQHVGKCKKIADKLK